MQPPLYRRVLGQRFAELSPLLRDVHDRQAFRAEGTFRIIRPPGLIKRLLGAWMGMPAATKDVPTELTVTRVGSTEKWERRFGEYKMVTWQRSWSDLLLERSGPVTFGIRVEIVGGGMELISRRVWLAGIPLPLFVAPGVRASVAPTSGGWRAKVELRFPLLGEMLTYEGEITPVLG